MAVELLNDKAFGGIDITGQKFGRWAVLGVVGYKQKPCGTVWFWRIKCDCGTECVRQASSLKNGKSKSCGCFHKEIINRHSQTLTPTHRSWIRMRYRCNNENCDSYKNYGGRGIRVCERWDTFENFLEDMGEQPSGTSIDRIDNDGNYCPGNCRWANSKTQANNRRGNRVVEFRGRSQTLKQWADELGMGYNAICKRLQHGWSIDRAFTQPVQLKNRRAASSL